MRTYSGTEMKLKMMNAPLRTKQFNVSIPIINRYIALLGQGRTAPNIKVADGVIIEGNHRYIAGYIYGKVPGCDPYINPQPSTPTYSFDAINYDPVDWEANRRGC